MGNTGRGSLVGRAVIVTGGGTGIGLACAERLVAEGATVTICGRNEARLADAAARIAEAAADGGAIHHRRCDVTDEDDVAALVAAAAEPLGALHGVVANAGGGSGMSPYHRQRAEDYRAILELNVMGTMFLVKHSAVPMAQAGGGSFVGMSSIAAAVTHPFFGAYTVAKEGIDAMMRNAADEYGRANLRYNAVRPGFITTEIMEAVPRDSEVYASYLANTPMNGVGEPADIANLVRFLLSDESRWITGQSISVDGGHCLRSGPDFSSFARHVVPDDDPLKPFLFGD